jgi:hypothetical protein
LKEFESERLLTIDCALAASAASIVSPRRSRGSGERAADPWGMLRGPGGRRAELVKTLIWIGMLVGATAGGYVPVLFGGQLLSLSSIVGNTVGGALGVFAGYKLAQRLGL